jgi:hypothetical protein
MMDYAKIAADALKQIQGAGFVLTLTRSGAPTMNPSTGEFTAGAEDTYTAYALEQAPVSTSVGGYTTWPGTDVMGGDKYFLLAASGMEIVPKARDKVTYGGETFTIAACRPVAPGGVDILYRVLARK